MSAHNQFHSDLSHHDVLEEWCHILYCCGEMGSATCSPDSWCRRFLIETAARKSDRSLTGPFVPDLFKVRYHCPWYLLNSSVETWYVWFSCSSSSISSHFCSFHPIASCDSRKTGSLRNRPWIPVKCSPWQPTFLQHLFHAFQVNGTLSVLRFCRVEHHDNAPSWTRSAG